MRSLSEKGECDVTTKSVSKKIEKLLRMYDDVTKACSGHERALYCLLKEFETEIPEPGEYFHKSFRQLDVTDRPATDMAIWHLLQEAPIFWMLFEAVQDEASSWDETK